MKEYIKIGELKVKDSQIETIIHKFPIYKRTSKNYVYLSGGMYRLPLLENDSDINITNYLNYFHSRYEVYSVKASDKQIIETLCRHYRTDIKLKMQDYLEMYEEYRDKSYVAWYKHEEKKLKEFTNLQENYMRKFKNHA